MSTPSRIRWILFLAASLWLMVLPSASAYIDPGSTSMVFQALIAFAMAAGLAVKTFWRRIRSFFTREPEPSAGEDSVT